MCPGVREALPWCVKSSKSGSQCHMWNTGRVPTFLSLSFFTVKRRSVTVPTITDIIITRVVVSTKLLARVTVLGTVAHAVRAQSARALIIRLSQCVSPSSQKSNSTDSLAFTCTPGLPACAFFLREVYYNIIKCTKCFTVK